MLVEHALEPLIGWDGFELTRKVLVFFLRRGGDEAVAEIATPRDVSTGDPGGHEPAHDRLRGLALSEPPLTWRSITAATRARSARSGAYAGLRRSPLALRLGPAKARLKIDESRSSCRRPSSANWVMMT
jgi:hypothetical protein